VGKDQHLPRDWKVAVKTDAQRSGTNNIRSIQLWRHRRIFRNNKIGVDRIYRVEYDASSNVKKSTKVAFVREDVATFYLKREPWIVDDVAVYAVFATTKKLYLERERKHHTKYKFPQVMMHRMGTTFGTITRIIQNFALRVQL